MVVKPNFVECETADQANRVDLKDYTFVGLRSEKYYVFKIRERK